jgi:hypothetical protein
LQPQRQVQQALRSVRIDFDRFRDLLSTGPEGNNELRTKNNALRAGIKNLKQKLSDLSRTISIVEQARARFPDIDDEELATRKKFVSDTTAILKDILQVVNSEDTKRRLADGGVSSHPSDFMSLVIVSLILIPSFSFVVASGCTCDSII